MRIWWALLVFLHLPTAGGAQVRREEPRPPSADAPSAVIPIHVDDVSSEGWQWLLEEARRSRFVLFGEQHGIRQIPQVVSRLLAELQPLGYDHLALEASPWLGREISRVGAMAVLTESPFELAFDDDAMVDLISTADAMGVSIWGLDQPVTAVHGFRRLADILPDWNSRRMARGLHLKAVLQEGRYIRSDYGPDFEALRSVVDEEELTPEANLLIDSMERSMKIYLAYFAGQRGEPVDPTSDEIREGFMVENFTARLAEFTVPGAPAPRAVVLMGGAHIMEGVGPNGVKTLGDFVEHRARVEGSRALHVGIRSRVDDAPSALPASFFDGTSSVIVDTRRLVESADRAWLEGLTPELRRDLAGYDALLVIGDAASDTRTALADAASEVRRRFMVALAMLVVPGLLLVPLATASAVLVWRRPGNSEGPRWPWALVGFGGVGTVALIVVQLLRLRVPEAAQLSPAGTLVSGLTLALFAVVVALTAAAALRHRWWSPRVRASYLLCTSLALVLAWQMTYWNVGGMLG